MIPVLHGVVDPTSSSDPAVPLLVLGPSLGTTSNAWAPAARHLLDVFRILRFDLPGHGTSPAASAPFSTAELAAGVVALVDSLGGGRFSYAGASFGGAIGIELALGPAADRLDMLVVVCSDARIGEADAWADRAEQVRRQGTAALIASTGARWFAPGFLAREPDLGGRVLKELLDVDDGSYGYCCEALAGFDRRADVARLSSERILVLAGDSDTVVTSEQAARLVETVPGAHLEILTGTGHQAAIERPDVVAASIRAMLPEGRYEAGMTVRRAVLGDAHVDRSLSALTPETVDFQRFITEYAWGGVWTRPGLDRRMRSAVTISSLVTARHWNELELHLHAGIRNGLTREELTEILLQTAIYAGVPAANSAFGIAKRVFAKHDEKSEEDHG